MTAAPTAIALHNGVGRAIVLDIDEIVSFERWLDGAIVRISDGTVCKVRECPEQIVKLVVGPEGADDSVDS